MQSINGFIVISNYTTGLYEFVSESIYPILGYKISDYTNEDLTKFIISIFDEKHLAFMMNSFLPVIVKYFKEHSSYGTGTDYRYTCCVKMKNVYNQYQWYLVDTVVIEEDENGFPLRTLITSTNINQFKKDDFIYYNIMKKNSDGIYEVMLEGVEDGKKDHYQLISREVEIISLIGNGFTGQQIADKLYLSLNTVKTHRKNILKKTGCKGTAELTNFAFSRGLL